jgi:GH25 family lysozyme M1 (1,4-beta-N-acetylmuramidase)
VIEGIDCSYYQGDIDWLKVAAAGKRFAIIRGGDRTFLDPMFETYLEGAKAAGLYVDIYHYLRFGLRPEWQAGVCSARYEIANRYNPKVRLWLDWEDTSNAAMAMTMEERREWARKLLNNLYCPIGHYSAAWWWNPYMGCFNLTGPKWVAHYRTGGSPILPSGWDNWQVWQYGSSGVVDGIEGNVDINVAQDGFFPLKEADMQTTPFVLAGHTYVLTETGFLHVHDDKEQARLERLGYDFSKSQPIQPDDPILDHCPVTYKEIPGPMRRG